MTPKTRYFIEILEKIGTPLMRAVLDSDAGAQGDVDQAQILAELLSRSVQASINMGSGFNFVDMPDQGDSVRVALAALAAPLVSAQYVQSKVMPGEAELAKMVAVMESVLTFAENFKPSEENAQRLAELKASGQAVDGAQAELQYIQAFIPVVQAVSEFSFGQPEKKLALDIADRLVKRSVEFRELQFPTMTDADEQKRSELVIVGAMAVLYADCHRVVMGTMASVAEAGGDVPSIDTVWAAFDLRASMLEAMMCGVIPGAGAAQGSSSAATKSGAPSVFAPPPPIDPDMVIEQIKETPAVFGEMPLPVEDDSPEIPAVESVIVPEDAQDSMPQAPQDSAPASDNPMAMFAAPKEEKDEEVVPAAVIPDPVEAAPVDADEKSEEEESKSGDSSNPMSFFKT